MRPESRSGGEGDRDRSEIVLMSEGFHMSRSNGVVNFPEEFYEDHYRSLDDEARSSASETREKIRAIFSGAPRIHVTLRKVDHAPLPATTGEPR
jgi:hypothetical protein